MVRVIKENGQITNNTAKEWKPGRNFQIIIHLANIFPHILIPYFPFPSLIIGSILNTQEITWMGRNRVTNTTVSRTGVSSRGISLRM